jgi:KTSC domain
MRDEFPDSKTIRAASYDGRSKELQVQFADGRLQRYSRVPPEIYVKLVETHSKDDYLETYIKPFYELQSSDEKAA